jgi:hypothetical protein
MARQRIELQADEAGELRRRLRAGTVSVRERWRLEISRRSRILGAGVAARWPAPSASFSCAPIRSRDDGLSLTIRRRGGSPLHCSSQKATPAEFSAMGLSAAGSPSRSPPGWERRGGGAYRGLGPARKAPGRYSRRLTTAAGARGHIIPRAVALTSCRRAHRPRLNRLY